MIVPSTKHEVIIVSKLDDAPEECPRCRSRMFCRHAIGGSLALYECDFVVGETHVTWVIVDWLGVHIMEGMHRHVEMDALQKKQKVEAESERQANG